MADICPERAELEQKMRDSLTAAAQNSDVTTDPDFALVLEAVDGHQFRFEHAAATLTTEYESASTSKWVAAAVILDLVDQGVLALDDEPADYLDFWEVPGITLAQLLSFTSGFSSEALCINLPNADFADCVQRIYENNLTEAAAPGTTFEYASSHLQIAGLMAIRAAGVSAWSELFEAWQTKTGLFPTGVFDLPSAANPRLAGGMHWRGLEYLDFLRALQQGQLLESATREAMHRNQRGDAEVVASPALAIGQDWAYGFGNWLECPTAIDGQPFNCNAGYRNSSPGAYGAYPFIDFEHRYIGLLARQGTLGSFVEGNAIFASIADDAALWAAACQP
jgi:CubicO group peptidase (beta-lactamase class C family)